jgi:hypothetical protein
MCSQAVIRRDCLRISGSNLSPSSPPSNLGKGGGAGGGGGAGRGKPSVVGGLWWRRMQRLLLSSYATPLSREFAQSPSPLPASEALSAVATHQAIPSGVCARAIVEVFVYVCV